VRTVRGHDSPRASLVGFTWAKYFLFLGPFSADGL
jgi:hypothetical protein